MQKLLLLIATLFLVTPVWADSDFYNRILAVQVDQFAAEANNIALSQSPSGLAGDNMITTGQSQARNREARTNDFYNRVLLAQLDGYNVENDSLAPSRPVLAGNNMITDEQAFSARGAQDDFYNRVLSAQVDEYGVENNAIAPSALEFAQPQTFGELPGSMAANIGTGRQSDWYSRTVAIQAELNRRAKNAETF